MKKSHGLLLTPLEIFIQVKHYKHTFTVLNVIRFLHVYSHFLINHHIYGICKFNK